MHIHRHFSLRRLARIVPALLLLAGAGCATDLYQNGTVADLQVPKQILMYSLDGRLLGENDKRSGCHIPLTPGEHHFEFYYYQAYFVGSQFKCDYQILSLGAVNAEAGRSYRIAWQKRSKDDKKSASITDLWIEQLTADKKWWRRCGDALPVRDFKRVEAWVDDFPMWDLFSADQKHKLRKQILDQIESQYMEMDK